MHVCAVQAEYERWVNELVGKLNMCSQKQQGQQQQQQQQLAPQQMGMQQGVPGERSICTVAGVLQHCWVLCQLPGRAVATVHHSFQCDE